MYIKVRVVANSKKEKIEQKSEDHFNICVKEKAQRNMANSRIIEIISQYFDVPLSAVRIINGHHSPSKILSVRKD
jgi:uncharacterized protein YggU (UPF0235/DUF167 family)